MFDLTGLAADALPPDEGVTLKYAHAISVTAYDHQNRLRGFRLDRAGS